MSSACLARRPAVAYLFLVRSMKLFWGAALNVVAIGLSVGIGYAEMEPPLLSQANPDAVFCTVVLLGTIFFAPDTV